MVEMEPPSNEVYNCNEGAVDEDVDTAIAKSRAELLELRNVGDRMRKNRNEELLKKQIRLEPFEREWKLWKQKGRTSVHHVSKDDYVAVIRKVFAEGPGGDLSSQLTWWCKDESKLLRAMHHFLINKNQCERVAQYHHEIETSLRRILSDLRREKGSIEAKLMTAMSNAFEVQQEMEQTYKNCIDLQIDIVNAYKDKQYATSRSRARFIPDANQLQQQSNNRRTRARLGGVPTNIRSTRSTANRRKESTRSIRPNRQGSIQRKESSAQKSMVDQSIRWTRNPPNSGLIRKETSKVGRPNRQASVQRNESPKQKAAVNESIRWTRNPSTPDVIEKTASSDTESRNGASRRPSTGNLKNKKNTSPRQGSRRKRTVSSKSNNNQTVEVLHWKRIPSSRQLLKPVVDGSVGASVDKKSNNISNSAKVSSEQKHELAAVIEESTNVASEEKSVKSATTTTDDVRAGRTRRNRSSGRSLSRERSRRSLSGERKGRSLSREGRKRGKSSNRRRRRVATKNVDSTWSWERIPSTRNICANDGKSSLASDCVKKSINKSVIPAKKDDEPNSVAEKGVRNEPDRKAGTTSTSSSKARSRKRGSRRKAKSPIQSFQWERIPTQHVLNLRRVEDSKASSKPIASKEGPPKNQLRVVPETQHKKVSKKEGAQATERSPDSTNEATASRTRRGSGRFRNTFQFNPSWKSDGPNRGIGRCKSHSGVSQPASTDRRTTLTNILASEVNGDGSVTRQSSRRSPVRGVRRCCSHSGVGLLTIEPKEISRPSSMRKPSRRKSHVDNSRGIPDTTQQAITATS